MESYSKKRAKISFTEIDTAYLDSPRRELSNGGLGIVVALLVHWGVNFLCVSTGSQSNPTVKRNEYFALLIQSIGFEFDSCY